MSGFEIRNRRFARYILSNAKLEELAAGFRWLEGPVWMGDAGCLLFQDLPNNRTMRWIEGLGASVYRAPQIMPMGRPATGKAASLRAHIAAVASTAPNMTDGLQPWLNAMMASA